VSPCLSLSLLPLLLVLVLVVSMDQVSAGNNLKTSEDDHDVMSLNVALEVKKWQLVSRLRMRGVEVNKRCR
jgi:predicted nucleic acid-binding protein